LIASEIILSKNINSLYRQKIEKDLEVLDGFAFNEISPNETSKIMKINVINTESVSRWLKERVHFIVEENILSFYNLSILKIISLERSEVEYPNADSIPYSITNPLLNSETEQNNLDQKDRKLTLMSNLSASIYIQGKREKELYTIKISRGLLKKPYNVKVTSPRSGIIQIGEGLFDPETSVNPENPEAISNNILRLATLFHEARHSDGNGKSLGFAHTVCPRGHDFEGIAACDENLNGPYTIGKLMLTEMNKSCVECSERDKQILKLIILDSGNRVLKTTHTNEKSTNWDDETETL
jgi:hypothetical protein